MGIGSSDVEIVRSVVLRSIDLLDYILFIHLVYFCVNDHEGPWNTWAFVDAFYIKTPVE